MWMFWAFKLGFGVDILAFLATFFQKLGNILFSFLVTLPPSNSLYHYQSIQNQESYSRQWRVLYRGKNRICFIVTF